MTQFNLSILLVLFIYISPQSFAQSTRGDVPIGNWKGICETPVCLQNNKNKNAAEQDQLKHQEILNSLKKFSNSFEIEKTRQQADEIIRQQKQEAINKEILDHQIREQKKQKEINAEIKVIGNDPSLNPFGVSSIKDQLKKCDVKLFESALYSTCTNSKHQITESDKPFTTREFLITTGNASTAIAQTNAQIQELRFALDQQAPDDFKRLLINSINILEKKLLPELICMKNDLETTNSACGKSDQ